MIQSYHYPIYTHKNETKSNRQRALVNQYLDWIELNNNRSINVIIDGGTAVTGGGEDRSRSRRPR